MRLGLCKINETTMYVEYCDFAGSGFIGRTLKTKASAGRNICVQPGIGKWLEMQARTDLLAWPGAEFVTTDIGPGRIVWVPNSQIAGAATAWKQKQDAVLLYSNTLVSGALSASQQTVVSLTLPIGLLALQKFQIDWEFGKNGATDTMTQAGLHLGPLGTFADPALLNLSGAPLLTAANRSYGISASYESTTNTNIFKRGSNGGVGSYNGQASSTPLQTAITTTALNTALKLTMSATMGGTTDKPQLGSLKVWGLPG